MEPVPFVDLRAQFAAIQQEVEEAIARVLERGDFIQGEALGRFESNFAEACGVGHAVGVNSGTDALRFALLARGVGQGDEVILPANTFFATAAAVDSVGATPVFVDVEKSTANLDPGQLEDVVSERTRAVIGVHLYGRLCDVGAVSEFCAGHGLDFIEDAAQAHLAERGGDFAGSFGRAGAFSFYPGKNLGAYGDGGAVTTDDPELAGTLQRWRNFGQGEKHHHREAGLNSRLDTLQAAVLDVKLRHLPSWTEARRRHVESYTEKLRGIEGVEVLTVPAGRESAPHLFVVRVPERDRVVAGLQAVGVGAQVHYPVPIHLQPAFAKLNYERGSFPIAEELSADILSLPLFPELTEAQLERVVASLRDVVSRQS